MGRAQYSGAMRGATMADSPPARPGYGSRASVCVGGGSCRGNYFDKVFTYPTIDTMAQMSQPHADRLIFSLFGGSRALPYTSTLSIPPSFARFT